MMMAMANRDGSFTVTLYLPYAGRDGFDLLKTPDDVMRFFQERFPDAIPHIPDLAEAFFANPTGSLVTVRCAPWHMGGKVVLLGDAAHAVVPFYGQGANASFEDCLTLAAQLREKGDRSAALAAYEADRKPNTDALADLAIDNFREMRDRVASPLFLFRKKFEKFLNKLMPETYIPLYPMISFTRIPYAEARERAIRQWRTVRTILGVTGLVLFLVVLEKLWR
jgi:kynurenine 3-monooxygenase